MISREFKQPADSIKFLSKIAYLFLIDPNRLLLSGRTLVDFEKTEVGYTAAILNAFHFAFTAHKQPRMLTHDFVQTIRKLAMSHVEDKKHNDKDHYRSSYVHYIALPAAPDDAAKKINQNFFPSATVKGLREFISEWIDKEHCYHSVELEPVDPAQDSSFLLTKKNDELILAELTSDKQMIMMQNPTVDFFIKIYEQNKFTVKINSLSEDFLPKGFSIKNAIEKKMAEIFHQYQIEIANAKSNDDKLLTIIRCIKKIEQLHPFYDGNLRTNYILFSLLCHEEGLPLSLMIDLNRFDLFSESELFDEVKLGQARFLKLCGGEMCEWTDRYVLGSHFNKEIPLLEVDGINDFINVVLLANYNKITAQNFKKFESPGCSLRSVNLLTFKRDAISRELRLQDQHVTNQLNKDSCHKAAKKHGLFGFFAFAGVTAAVAAHVYLFGAKR